MFLNCHLFEVYKNKFLINSVNQYIINLFSKNYDEKKDSNLDKYNYINKGKYNINEYTRKNNFINNYINDLKHNLTQQNILDKYVAKQKENMLKIQQEEIENNFKEMEKSINNGLLNNLQSLGFKKTLHLYSQYYLAN